jgi:hypothetical protein
VQSCCANCDSRPGSHLASINALSGTNPASRARRITFSPSAKKMPSAGSIRIRSCMSVRFVNGARRGSWGSCT